MIVPVVRAMVSCMELDSKGVDGCPILTYFQGPFKMVFFLFLVVKQVIVSDTSIF